jgi:6-phosphogluconolactonase (cycloisomerase 2 family)
MQPGSSSLTLVGGSLLHPGSPLHLSRNPTALSAITFTPATPAGAPAQELLFVTGNSDPVNHSDNTVSVYAVASDGTLTEQPNSPYATATIDPLSVLAVNTSPAGQTNVGGVFVYVGGAGNASGALDVFQVCTVVGQGNNCTSQDVTDALMVPVGTPTSVGQKPVAIVVDPTNSFLYVACEDTSQVFGFRITTPTGVLTAPANQSTGTSPVAMALHPSVNNTGQFLFTSNSGSSNISGFTLSTTSGSMSSPITVNSPAGPSGMAAR